MSARLAGWTISKKLLTTVSRMVKGKKRKKIHQALVLWVEMLCSNGQKVYGNLNNHAFNRSEKKSMSLRTVHQILRCLGYNSRRPHPSGSTPISPTTGIQWTWQNVTKTRLAKITNKQKKSSMS